MIIRLAFKLHATGRCQEATTRHHPPGDRVLPRDGAPCIHRPPELPGIDFFLNLRAFIKSKPYLSVRQIRTLSQLHHVVAGCALCPRLVAWREEVARVKVARYRDDPYWGKPVPAFGDPKARLLIVGLAPGAHGANRTGRMFTGDRSGDWLYRALFKFGFANQPQSISRDDGLKLTDCYITASARCAPPANKPDRTELENCRPYLGRELQLLGNVRVIVALGKVGFDTVFDSLRRVGMTALPNRPAFGHGKEYALSERQILIASFHPSQQNTFTGKLTEQMFDSVFKRVRELIRTS